MEALELAGVGVLAGALAGVFGVGGGILFVPALVLVGGLEQLDANATSLAAMIPVVAAGAWRQHTHGNVRWRPALAIGLVSAVGVGVGTVVAGALPEHVLRILFAILLLGTAVRLALSARRPQQPGE